MGSWADEYESAIEMVDEAAEELRELNPDHELLKYWFLTPQEEKRGRSKVKEKALNVEMKNRFWMREDSWCGHAGMVVAVVVMTNYALALQKATDEAKAEPIPA